MTIVPSRRDLIDRLLADLTQGDPVHRDRASARLTLLGEAVVERLVVVLEQGDPATGVQLLAVLEQLPPRRVVPALRSFVRRAPPDALPRIAEALTSLGGLEAIAALTELVAHVTPATRRKAVAGLARLQRAGAAEALAPLVDVTLSERDDAATWLTAIEALGHLSEDALEPLLERLRGASDPALAQRAPLLRALSTEILPLLLRIETGPPKEERQLIARLNAHGPQASLAISARLTHPDLEPNALLRLGRALASLEQLALEPLHGLLEGTESAQLTRVLAEVLAQRGSPASIPALHQALKRAGLGALGPNPDSIAEVKAHIHGALATLGSGLALYDLREMLLARPARAVPSLLRSAARSGDATLIPALAALASDLPEMLDLCQEAFAAIATRSRLRRSSRALAAVPGRHAAALEALWSRWRSQRTQ